MIILKKTLLPFLALILSFLFIHYEQALAQSQMKPDYYDIPIDKEWNFIFNEELDKTYYKINVTDKYGNFLPHRQFVRKQSIVLQPIDFYTQQLPHTIEFLEDITNKSGDRISIPPIHFVTEHHDYTDVLQSDGDFHWYFNANIPGSFFYMNGLKNGELVAGLTKTPDYDFGLPGKIGNTKSEIRNLHKNDTRVEAIPRRFHVVVLPNRERIDTYLHNGKYVHYFYDRHKNDTVRLVLWTKKEVEEAKLSYFVPTSKQYQEDAKTIIFHLVNAERAMQEQYTPYFSYKTNLDQVAQAHSEDMVRRNFFSHTNPDHLEPIDRLHAAQIFPSYAGENIASRSMDAFHLHESLMDSYDHRMTILDPGFTKVGFGLAFDKFNAPYLTQVFTD